MQKTLLKWLVLVVLLAYAAFAAVWAGEAASLRKCAGVEIRIDKRSHSRSLTSAGVKAQIDRFDPTLEKKRIKDINLKSLEKYLEKFNYFESVECSFTSTGKLRVDVVPLVPELRVFDSSGTYYINKAGKRMEATPNFFVDVPVATGNFTKDFPAGKILPLINAIKKDEMLSQLVSMVAVDSPDNIILVPRISGHVINIGNLENLDTKFHNLKLMYREVIPYKGWETYDTISVKFRGQIVATRADKTILNHPLEIEEEEDPEEATLEGIVPEGGLPATYEQVAAEKRRKAEKLKSEQARKQPQTAANKKPTNNN